MFLLLPATAVSQSLQNNDFAARNKSMGIRQEVQTVVTFTSWGEPIDTCDQVKITYNESGQVTHVLDYHACGEPLAEQKFYYDAAGKMTGGAIGYVTNHCKLVPVSITLNEKGKLMTRTLSEPIPELWHKETYTYDKYGLLISSEQWQLNNGELTSLGKHKHEGAEDIMKKPTELQTHWYDDRGLLREERVLDRKKMVQKIVYQYEYY